MRRDKFIPETVCLWYFLWRIPICADALLPKGDFYENFHDYSGNAEVHSYPKWRKTERAVCRYAFVTLFVL